MKKINEELRMGRLTCIFNLLTQMEHAKYLLNTMGSIKITKGTKLKLLLQKSMLLLLWMILI